MPELVSLAKCNFMDVFLPYFPLPSQQVSNLSTGVLTFLQWDLHVGSAAILLWAVLLHRNATTEPMIGGRKASLPMYKELLAGERLSRGTI